MAARTTITALNDGSNEAVNCNLLYATVRDWCFSVANWNFARKTAVLTLQKSNSPIPGNGLWTSSFPAPPWAYQYAYPADAVKIQYITSQAASGTKWPGLPQRFAIATDVISAVQARVILTNQATALAVYTVAVADPTLWTPLFSQAVVSTLAWLLCGPISGDKELVKFLEGVSQNHMTLAVTANLSEGLIMDDTTPEWIQARGIVYPQRRPQNPLVPRPEPQSDSRR